ncbi:MAG: DUF4097 domain-containing protein, partial [Chloroflexota bacterium]|nr:DUF4097 domain-containing protein [Chloroflexota bacterium]
MAEERMRVLEMIREGKITAEEGARLLDALRTAGAPQTGAPSGASAGGSGAEAGSRRADDPLGSIAGMVAEILQKSGWAGRGWKGSWSSGPLNGSERRRQREAEGWEVISLSEGDHGTFDLPAGARLTVESESGGVEATAGSGLAHLNLSGEGLTNFAIYGVRRGTEVILSAYRTEHFARLPRMHVQVPSHVAQVTLKTSGGGLHASGLRCPVTLRTAGGSIHVREQGEGAVDARTSGGGIDVQGRPTTVDLHTSGGGITFRGTTQAFQAQTSGGSITLDGARLTAGEHRAKTAGGSIRVLLAPESSVDLSAQTSAGHISVDLPGVQGEQSGPRMSPRYRGRYNG